jgi:hypothetical protein
LQTCSRGLKTQGREVLFDAGLGKQRRMLL